MKGWFRSHLFKGSAEKVERSEEESSVHPSLGFNTLYHQFRGTRKYRILDLGPAVGDNIDFFSQFRCRIYIEDLYRTLNSFEYLAPDDGFSYSAVFEYLMPYLKNTRFDFILAWDVFNYLEREELRHLIVHLSQFSRKGTVLFGLISTLKHIPETPYRFRIVDSENLLYSRNSRILKPCPRYEPSDLGELMPNFRICNSFLLRNGFKEYLFLCD
jgi:hypothetical protein